MDKLNSQIQDAMKPYGYKVRTVSIVHLTEAQDEVGRLIRRGLVDKGLSANWHFYLKTSEDLPQAETIFVVAMPQPFTHLTFAWQGMTYPADIPPTYFTRADDSRAESVIQGVLGPAGYRMVKARLALKTLAVRSSLAAYGKNNLAYVPDMGSLFQLVAFYADCSCEEDGWREPEVMKACADCALCHQACPNGSITAGRFLIHAERCLGFLNEQEPGVPHWVKCQPDWRHALIGCLSCQSVCPVNRPYLQNIAAGPSFSEDETAVILNDTRWERLEEETRNKLADIRGIYPLLPRNLAALIEKQRLSG
jgi:epoxyqueuosine reductase